MTRTDAMIRGYLLLKLLSFDPLLAAKQLERDFNLLCFLQHETASSLLKRELAQAIKSYAAAFNIFYDRLNRGGPWSYSDLERAMTDMIKLSDRVWSTQNQTMWVKANTQIDLFLERKTA